MTLRLTRLELHGFKSFAQRTVFDLAGGLTAVVGPNGSGKSNLSEAVRWALGEQSNSALRGKRGEDVIFAGSSSRAPLGMAEVTLTLDNAGGELAVDFSEVTVTRRVFRDGETHYLLNGSRVRLRDLLAVTAPLGQSYTVVGQGLVDAALSARPDERRGLFEHAAGIVPLRLKRGEAERRLTEAETNRTRLDDLRAELEPRLRALERAAKQAAEYHELHATLLDLRHRLFRDLWREARAALDAAERDEAIARAANEAARATVARHTAAQETQRACLVATTEERRTLAAREAELLRQAETLRRELAVDETRLGALQRRLADLREAARTHAARERALLADRERLLGEADESTEQLGRLRDEATALERELAEVQRERVAAARELRETVDAIAALERERSTQHRHAIATTERHATLQHERQRVANEREHATEHLAQLGTAATALAGEVTRLEAAREVARTAEHEGRARLDALTAAEREAATALTAAERRVAETRARLDGLRQLVASGEGFFGGVHAVLTAARAGRLHGIISPVASILEAPTDLETALEVALGGHLQDLVVERWADAEAAIAFLKERRAGRATFQPLDTLRAPSGSGAPANVARAPGVLGVAAELVRYEPRFAPLARGLLGRTLIVEDLTTTRRVLPALSGGWSIVTRGGEIARGNGAVTGGTTTRQSGVLARERTLRELPREVTATEAARDATAATLAARQAELRDYREELAGHERQRHAAERALDDARHRAGHLERDRQAIAARTATLARRLAELDQTLAALDAELATSRARDAGVAERLAALETHHQALAATLERAGTTGEEERSRLTALRADLARAEERQHGRQRQAAALTAQLDLLQREASERATREATLAGEERALVNAIEARRDALAGVERDRADVAARLHPLDDRRATAERDLTDTGAALATANEEALRHEQALGTRAVETARRRGELDVLARRIGDELEVLDPAALFENPAEERAAPSLAPAERADLTSQVDRLAARLRRLGPPNAEALAEHEREASRWRFLTEQLSDVERTARALRGVLGELDQTMAERFSTTFTRVAEEFRDTFTDLFGGGAARLVLNEPADVGEGPGGVEIVAQPPGKRLQNLSLLSGGERALTAVALLFAILRVNPSPFCVLDEVDAALDESNVVRFRERLQRLAEQTQFVVITHNRGTIEGADTLYGITMGADGVSRVLSLRLAAPTARELAGN